MKIALLVPNYNWQSYSVHRCIAEGILEHLGLDIVFRPLDLPNFDVIIIVGNPQMRYTKQKEQKLIFFSFSAPARFDPIYTRQSELALISCKETADRFQMGYYFPVFADEKFFKPTSKIPEYHCVFVGAREHKRSRRRGEFVDKLRQKGFKILTAGYGWSGHKDDLGIVSGQQLVETYNSGWLSLDLTDKDAAMPSRLIQASLCGRASITSVSRPKLKLLSHDEVFYTDDSFENYYDNIKLILNDKAKLMSVALKARKRCLKDHTSTVRLKWLMPKIRKVLGLK